MSLLQEYLEQRDKLIERRNELLKRRRIHKITNLKQSKQSSKRQKVETIARTMKTYQYSKNLISKYSRLPEMNIDIRLKYAHMTCPWMNISEIKKKINLKTDKYNDSKNGSIEYSTKLNFDTCGDFIIELNINIENESVNSIKIIPQGKIETIAERETILTLINDSIKFYDISRFVYGMNSLLRMRHKRKREYMSIIDVLDLNKFISINGFPVSNIKSVESLELLLFENSPTFIEVELSSKKFMRVDWQIKFQKGQNHCVSDITGSVIQNDQEGNPKSIENITKLLKNLIKANDIKSAVLQILNIL
ncbi:hypothetical protein C6P40_001948 [Pichia californica]|uniref:Uncharacterized protein n=1 Tax=Pichia californica TaxID=460514 RepID=A0A9P6WIH5_9ASCO|nr:hypothetical protein C6P42_001927 [[Candida] californica]KAG0687730.1 hypothetical protein C6P40_001948 [[Candida] californica]